MQREFIYTDKWLDLMFENRNQSYGAYVLRKRLPRNILIGYITAVVFMGTIVFTGYKLSTISIDKIKSVIDDLPASIIYEIKPVTPPLPPEKKPEIKNPPSKPSTENLIPIIKDSSNEVEPKKDDLKPSEIISSKDTSGSGDSRTDLPVNGADSKEFSESKDPLPIYLVGKKPEFPGGESSLMKFMGNNAHYPYQYLSDGITGIVYISFVVDSTGKVYQIKCEKGVPDYSQFTDEAMKAVSKMPRWIPGQQNGRNVSVSMTLPVKFSIKKDY